MCSARLCLSSVSELLLSTLSLYPSMSWYLWYRNKGFPPTYVCVCVISIDVIQGHKTKKLRKRFLVFFFFLFTDSLRLISISTSLFSQGGDVGNVGARKVRLREEKKLCVSVMGGDLAPNLGGGPKKFSAAQFQEKFPFSG